MKLMVFIRSQLGIAFWKHMAPWAFAIALSAVPLRAQTSSTANWTCPHCGSMQPSSQPGDFANMEPLPKPVVTQDETCLPWNLSDVRGAPVSAIRLGVPSKARREYNKACGAFKKKKLPEAEQHVRDAIQKYSNYVAAWVMLGQVLQDEQKMNEAHEACSKPLSVDPTYLPPYLCLSDLLDRQNRWGDLLTMSDRFLGVNSIGDRYAYYYRAKAYFHIHKLPEAQKNVLAAIAIDKEHHQPALYFLLAQIYGKQGDVVDAATQARRFLKFSNGRQDKDAARQYLSNLQSQQDAK